MAETVEKIIRQYEELKGQRRNWDVLWQELADYIGPNKNNVIQVRLPGQKRTEKLFDSTAIHSNTLLSAAMQGNLTNSALRWFSLKMRDDDLNDDSDVAVWLEVVAKRIFLTLGQSNFSSEIQEVYSDLGAFGTGALFAAEKLPEPPGGFAGLRFQSFPVGSYVCSENADGIIDTLFRVFQFPVIQVVNIWGEDKVTDDVKKMLEKHPFEKVEILHAVFPRSNTRERDVTLSTPAKKLPFASFHLELKTKHLLSESGYFEFPYLVPRWSKSSGEIYGRGPGMTALPDIRTLNKAVEHRLSAWALSLSPPLEVEDRGVIGRIKLTPLSINAVKRSGVIKPIDIGARFDVANIQEAQIKEAIRQIFFVDQLQFPPRPGTPISATEAQIRFELMQRILGPTLGRLESELLSPLLNRVFRIMLRMGEFPPIPDIIINAFAENRAQIDVEYQGPLAVAQRAASVETIQRVYGILLPLSQAAPEILDNLNHDKVAREVSKISGLPADLLNSPKEIELIRQARVQAQKEESEKEELESGAKAIGKLTPLLKETEKEPAEATA